MRFKVEELDDILLIKLSGELTRVQASSLEHYIDNAITSGSSKFILDIEELRFLDSVTILTLLRLTREALYADGGIKLLRPRRSVKRFMSIGHVLELFDCYDTKFEAIKSFEKPQTEDVSQTYLQRMGNDQKTAVMHLAQLLIKKKILQPDELIKQMNNSRDTVMTLFQNMFVATLDSKEVQMLKEAPLPEKTETEPSKPNLRSPGAMFSQWKKK